MKHDLRFCIHVAERRVDMHMPHEDGYYGASVELAEVSASAVARAVKTLFRCAEVTERLSEAQAGTQVKGANP